MSAAMHAPFFGVCMSVAAAVAPPAKKPQAIALVQAGLTIAVMIGVPFGSFLGGFKLENSIWCNDPISYYYNVRYD